jgi:hypothetical protein
MCGLLDGKQDSGEEKDDSLRRRIWSWTKQNIMNAGEEQGKEDNPQTSSPGSTGLLEGQDPNARLVGGEQGWRGHDLHFQVSIRLFSLFDDCRCGEISVQHETQPESMVWLQIVGCLSTGQSC